MKIKVNKLFGRYDNEIDFDKKINILIGENGIGKSTTIKILDCLFRYNYIGLLEYYFDSIEIMTNDETILIKYDDIILDREYLVKKCCECWDFDYNLYINLRKEYDKYEDKIPSFVYQFDTFCNLIDDGMMYKVLKHNYNALNDSAIFKINYSSSYLDYIYNFYSNAETNKEDGIYYINSNISKIHSKVKKLLNRLQYNDIIMLNMASDFNVINDLNRKYATNDFEKQFMSKKYQEVLEQNKNAMTFFDDDDIFVKCLPVKYQNIYDDKILQELKDDYKINIPKKLDGNNIDFGEFLFDKIYSNALLIEFKNDFYNFLHDNVDNNDKSVKLSNKSFNKVRIYFYPLIPEKNILNKIFKYPIREDAIMDYVIGEELYLIAEFYKKYKEKYFEIKEPRLEKLNLLFKKYFTNKEVIATPFGISISTKDYNNDISFDELSSGEKKLIILFTITIFSDNLIILLDEPEMSMSVTWQKDLLSDLVVNTNYNRLLVATQSPYIVSNDELAEYLICLPMENKNE